MDNSLHISPDTPEPSPIAIKVRKWQFGTFSETPGEKNVDENTIFCMETQPGFTSIARLGRKALRALRETGKKQNRQV